MAEQDKSLKKAAKRGLKTMRKTKAHHPVRNEGRILKYGTLEAVHQQKHA